MGRGWEFRRYRSGRHGESGRPAGADRTAGGGGRNRWLRVRAAGASLNGATRAEYGTCVCKTAEARHVPCFHGSPPMMHSDCAAWGFAVPSMQFMSKLLRKRSVMAVVQLHRSPAGKDLQREWSLREWTVQTNEECSHSPHIQMRLMLSLAECS